MVNIIEPTELAKVRARDSYNATHLVPDQLEIDQMHIVWFSKTLQHWKAIVIGIQPPRDEDHTDDIMFFEVTYKGEPGKEETYVDTYRKEDNQVFSHHDI